MLFFALHFWNPPIRNKCPIIIANKEYIVSDIEFVSCILSVINSPAQRSKYIPAIKNTTGFRKGSFLNLLAAESPYRPKMKNTIATIIVIK